MKAIKKNRPPDIQAAARNLSTKLWGGKGRAYDGPEAIIASIGDPGHRLAAKLQLEGGCRAEGVGFPRSSSSPSAITLANLKGIKPDTYFPDRRLVGEIETTEKGGYTCSHFITVETYIELEAFLMVTGTLKGDHSDYLNSVNRAAHETGQYVPGRGTHGFKHCFAQRFFLEAIRAGKSLISAKHETSRRCSHHRPDIFPKFYSTRRKP